MSDLEAFGVEAGRGNYAEEAFYSIALVYTVLFNRVSKYLDAFKLTPAKMNVLMIIKHQGKEMGLSQRDIGQRLMVTPSNMTRLLNKLYRDKLIERSARAGDKRVKVIKISKKGSQLLDEVWAGYTKVIDEVMNKLTHSQQKILSEMLQGWFTDLKGS